MATTHKVVKIDDFFSEDGSGDYTAAEAALDAIGVADWILVQILQSHTPDDAAICIFRK